MESNLPQVSNLGVKIPKILENILLIKKKI